MVGFLASMTLALGVGAGVAMNHVEAREVDAATLTTVYYAVNTTYTVKLNFKLQGDANNWTQVNMFKIGVQYESKDVYAGRLKDLYDGTGTIQFQLYDGDTWKSQVEPITSWTSVDTYNNKLYTGSEWVTYNPTHTVTFINESGEQVTGTTPLTHETNQYSGLISTGTAGEKFRIKEVLGTTVLYHNGLEDGVTVATESGDYISVTAAGTYSVYFKPDTGKSWIAAAETSDIAYMYATYFLDVVECDYPNEPSGWTTAKDRYATLSDDAKDFIYDAENHWAVNDDLYKMIERYNMACKNHPSLEKFVKNHSGTARVVSAINIAPAVQESNNVTPIVIILATTIGLIAVASFFVIRRRKENN